MENLLVVFESHVHAGQGTPKVSKYQYLASVVQGQALKILQNYQATDNGYDAAVATFKKRYGNKEKQCQVAIEKLLFLSKPNNSQQSLTTFQLKLIGIVNELENLSIDVVAAEPFIRCIVLTKLPDNVKQ